MTHGHPLVDQVRGPPRSGPRRPRRAHLSGLRSPGGLEGPSASSGFRRLPSAVRLRPRLHLAAGGGLATRHHVRARRPGTPARTPPAALQPGSPQRAARPHLASPSRRLPHPGELRSRQAMATRRAGSWGPGDPAVAAATATSSPRDADCARPAPNSLYGPPPRPPDSRARRAGRDHRARAGGSRSEARAPQAAQAGTGAAKQLPRVCHPGGEGAPPG